MIESKVIIVGGGPAGSSCAWRLRQLGVEALILDKKTFPRHKLCAGWITPKVFRLLGVEPESYPGGKVLHRWYHFYIKGIRLPVRTRQYVIRRHEFDHWALERCGARVDQHNVDQITRQGQHYIIDGTYKCEVLIGAGGTNCPVYNTLFKSVSPRPKDRHITTLEAEFDYNYLDKRALFWYLDNHLSGYAWYTPKSDSTITIGIGGRLSTLKNRNENIRYHWNLFIDKLQRLSLVDTRQYKPKGWTYYTRSDDQAYQIDQAYIIGDSAGLATVDMGEGIRPAIQSGLRLAEAVAGNTRYNADTIGKYSIRDILFPGR